MSCRCVRFVCVACVLCVSRIACFACRVRFVPRVRVESQSCCVVVSYHCVVGVASAATECVTSCQTHIRLILLKSHDRAAVRRLSPTSDFHLIVRCLPLPSHFHVVVVSLSCRCRVVVASLSLFGLSVVVLSPCGSHTSLLVSWRTESSSLHCSVSKRCSSPCSGRSNIHTERRPHGLNRAFKTASAYLHAF